VAFRFGGEHRWLLTTKKICTFLQVSRSFLYRKIHEGQVPYLRVGRHYRFRRSDIIEALGGKGHASIERRDRVTSSPTAKDDTTTALHNPQELSVDMVLGMRQLDALRNALSLDQMEVGMSRELPTLMTKISPSKAAFRFGEGEEALLTTQDVCQLLRVSRSFMYRRIHEGRVPYLRMGRRYRFRREEIMEALAKVERTETSRGTRTPTTKVSPSKAAFRLFQREEITETPPKVERTETSGEIPTPTTKVSPSKVAFRFEGDEKTLLTTQDVCQFLGISRSFLYRKIHEGQAPCLRVGRRCWFRWEEIMEALVDVDGEFSGSTRSAA
jgi:excisionase family DNA binding protein